MTLFNVKQAKRIASGFYPDPTICQAPDGSYYMVNSSFEFFPGLPIWHSTDGLHWQFVRYAMDRPSQFPYESMGNSQGLYAPTLREHNGTYYLVVTNVNHGNMILTAHSPEEDWSEPIWIEGWPGIDPSLFFDDDGKVYICGNESGQGEEPGIYIAEINPDTGQVLTGRTRISGGITGSNPEGPHIYKRNGMYYLMWAEGGTEAGHMENMSRSASITGPYEMCPGNPLITNRSTHLTLQAIGHCDCAHFEDDRTLMVFHGTRNTDEYPAQSWLGREPYAVWFTWNAEGWPELADQSYDTKLSGNNTANESLASWVTPAIDTEGWYSVRDVTAVAGEENTNVADVSVKAAPIGWRLADGPVLVGTRQTDWLGSIQATITNPRTLLSGQAGVAIYANDRHRINVEFSPIEDRLDILKVRAFVVNDTLVSQLGTLEVFANQPLHLYICGSVRGYTCAVEQAQLTRVLGDAPGKVLSFPNAGGFTGILMGVYAHGNGSVNYQVRTRL